RAGGARPPLTDIDAFIDEHKDELGVEPICRILSDAGVQVAASSYYARKNRAESARSIADRKWDTRIVETHEANRGLYGARKMWKVLGAMYPEDRVAGCTVERRVAGLGRSGL